MIILPSLSSLKRRDFLQNGAVATQVTEFLRPKLQVQFHKQILGSNSTSFFFS